eukprot:c25324_g1_i1 orf=410-1306(-)
MDESHCDTSKRGHKQHDVKFKHGRNYSVNGPPKEARGASMNGLTIANPGSISASRCNNPKQVVAGKRNYVRPTGWEGGAQKMLPEEGPGLQYAMDSGRRYSFKQPSVDLRTTISEVIVWGERITVTLTNEASIIQRWIQRQTGKHFGLDVEWRPNFVKGQENKIALLQICGKNDCLIIQMLFLETIPKELEGFLTNGQNTFVGVGIGPDTIKLNHDYGLVCAKVVELTTLAAEQLKRVDLKCTSLKQLVQEVLGFEIKKPRRITMSNWSKRFMDSAQVEYAAIDAWAASAIFHQLIWL